MTDIWMLEYAISNGEYPEMLYLGAFTTEEKAKEAFDKFLDKELLKGTDAVNKWRPLRNGPGADGMDTQEFRTGNWGYCIWTLKRVPIDEIGKIGNTHQQDWDERFGPDGWDKDVEDDIDDDDEPF